MSRARRNRQRSRGLGSMALGAGLAAMILLASGVAQACRGNGTAADCLRQERACMDGAFSWFRSGDYSCGDCPVRPPAWNPGPPNTAPMSEFLPAVGETIAAIPGAIWNGFKQVGNDVVACVTDFRNNG